MAVKWNQICRANFFTTTGDDVDWTLTHKLHKLYHNGNDFRYIQSISLQTLQVNKVARTTMRNLSRAVSFVVALFSSTFTTEAFHTGSTPQLTRTVPHSFNVERIKKGWVRSHGARQGMTSEESAVGNPKSEIDTTSSPANPTPLYLHHTAIKTRDIEVAIQFYSLFGFSVETKFRTGSSRAAWLTNAPQEQKIEQKGQNDVSARLELLEIPAYMLQEKEGTRKRAIDLVANDSLLGLNHLALDVTAYINQLKRNGDEPQQESDLSDLEKFLNQVSKESVKEFGKTLRIALKPEQKVIGSQVYEVAFVYDADGSILELVRYIKDLGQNVQSGWEPWDGTGFVGSSGEGL